jgi:hypothetical protein
MKQGMTPYSEEFIDCLVDVAQYAVVIGCAAWPECGRGLVDRITERALSGAVGRAGNRRCPGSGGHPM